MLIFFDIKYEELQRNFHSPFSVQTKFFFFFRIKSPLHQTSSDTVTAQHFQPISRHVPKDASPGFTKLFKLGPFVAHTKAHLPAT